MLADRLRVGDHNATSTEQGVHNEDVKEGRLGLRKKRQPVFKGR
jgi:hypothetical protein